MRILIAVGVIVLISSVATALSQGLLIRDIGVMPNITPQDSELSDN